MRCASLVRYGAPRACGNSATVSTHRACIIRSLSQTKHVKVSLIARAYTKIKVETRLFKSFSREWPIKIVSHATSSSSSRWTSSNVVVTPRICASVIPECAVL